MKTLLTLPFLLLSLVSFPSWSETMDDLVVRDGLYYKKFSDIPFTGEVDGRLDQGKFRNGKMDGPWISHHNNGQLYSKGEYKNGKLDGPWTFYYDNGGLYRKGVFMNDKEEGLFIQYWKNGQLLSKGNYKKGFREGRWFSYTQTGNFYPSESGVYVNGLKISD